MVQIAWMLVTITIVYAKGIIMEETVKVLVTCAHLAIQTQNVYAEIVFV